MQDIADIFCRLWDRLSRDLRPHAQFLANDEALVARGIEVERAILAGTWRDEARDGVVENTLGTLLGLDAAIGRAAPGQPWPGHPQLIELRERWNRTGRFNSDATSGALLVRHVQPARRSQMVDDVDDIFDAVIRVPPDSWASINHVVLPEYADLTPEAIENGLRVACVPFVGHRGELDWSIRKRRQVAVFAAQARDDPVLHARVAKVLRVLDSSGAHVALLPEMACCPSLLAAWQAALRDRGRDSALRLLMPGTGNLAASDPPSNTAVLLDARTGAVLAEQHKLDRFTLRPDEIPRFGLWFGEDGVEEDLTPGSKLTVIESRVGRLVMLICEDLASLTTVGHLIHKVGASVALVAVFSRPTQLHRWEHGRASVLVDKVGTSVYVANSLVSAELLGEHTPVGTALAITPDGAKLGCVSAAGDVVLFDVRPGAEPDVRQLPPAA